MAPRARALALVALAGALGSVGCGEKDEPAAPNAASALAEGDRICAESQKRIAALRAQPPSGPKEAAELTRGVVAVYEDEIARLADLAVPPDLKADLDRYLAAREETLVLLRDGLAAAEDGDEAGYAEAQAEVAAGQVERTRLAEAVGFGECSRPAGAG